MSLTKQDLRAIKEIVDEAIEESDQRTAAGFLAVDEQFARVWQEFEEIREIVARIDRVQQAEIERNDHQDLAIHRIRTNLHAV